MDTNSTDPIIEEFLKGYEQAYDYYEKLAGICRQQCEALLRSAGIRAIFTSRAKHPTGLREKLYNRHATKMPYTCVDDINRDIVDFSGVRVALYFPGDQDKVRKLIESNFDVDKVRDDFEPKPTLIYKKNSLATMPSTTICACARRKLTTHATRRRASRYRSPPF